MEVQLHVRAWVSMEIDAKTIQEALDRAKQMNAEEFLKTKGFLVNDSSVAVTGVFDDKPLSDLCLRLRVRG